MGIYKKLLITYISILGVIIIILSVALSQFFKANIFEKNQDSLIDTGHYINTLFIQYQRDEYTQHELIHSINIIGEVTNSRILLIEGASDLSDIALLRDTFSSENESINNSIDEILKGEIIVQRRQYTEELNTYVLAVGMPAKIENEITGAIILFTPVYEIDQALQQVRSLIIVTALMSFIIGSILIFFLSKTISRPIIKVSQNAKKIAEGEKISDINISSKDEVGELINSFNYMRQQLEVTEKIRKDLIAGVSHELRAPISAIRGFIQGIIDGVISEGERDKYLTIALNETNRLTNMTSELLDLAKLGSGNICIYKEKINIVSITEEVVNLFTAETNKKKLSVELKKIKNEIFFLGDYERIKQLVLNLLSNAVKNTSEGKSIYIEIKEQESFILFKINDQGVGIPEEDIPFIFDEFYRVDKSRSTSSGGMGLGLTIVKNIVDIHDGSIKIESKLGVGTIVTVMLPK